MTRVRNRLGVGWRPLVMMRRLKMSPTWSGRPRRPLKNGVSVPGFRMIMSDDHRVLGTASADRELLDAAEMVGHLVKPGSVYAFLAEPRQDVFPDALFADLFPSSTGRPSIAADVIGSVMVLQRLHDFSDGEAAEAARCDLRWKVACGLSLTYAGFDPSTLGYWRRRLANSDRPNRIFDAGQAGIAGTGDLRGKNNGGVAPAHMHGPGQTQDTLTPL